MSHLRPLFTWRSAIVESDLPPTARHVALTLALHMNERGGSCFPSQATLASETGLYVGTVKKTLQALVDAGWLERRVVRRGVGRGTRSEYEATDPTRGSEKTGVLSTGVQECDQGVGEVATRGSEEGCQSSSVSTSVEEAPTHFEILLSLRTRGVLSSSIAQIAEIAEALRRRGVPAEEGAVVKSMYEVLGA